MKYLIVAIIFISGMGFMSLTETIDAMIQSGAPDIEIWFGITMAIILIPLALLLRYIEDHL